MGEGGGQKYLKNDPHGLQMSPKYTYLSNEIISFLIYLGNHFLADQGIYVVFVCCLKCPESLENSFTSHFFGLMDSGQHALSTASEIFTNKKIMGICIVHIPNRQTIKIDNWLLAGIELFKTYLIFNVRQLSKV